MKPIFLIFILVFLITLYIVYRYSYNYFKKETSDKMWKLWGLRTPYWEGVVIVSFGVTTIIVLLLKGFI
jgi:hypothetical protein